MTRATVGRRWAATVGSAVVALGLASCTPSAPPAAQTATVSRADITSGVSASGALSAVGTENLGFATSGKLTSVRVHVGDRVKAGQVLATIDATAAKQALAQAEANLKAQQAALDRITTSTTVSGAESTVDQAKSIVNATKGQVAATADADQATIDRAKVQLKTDQDAKDQADSAVKTVKGQCKAATAAAAAAAAAPATPSPSVPAGAPATGGDAATACSQVLTAQAAATAAKQRVVADQTAVVTAQQKKQVDAASGKLAVANAEQGLVAAQNGLNSSASDRPHSIDQQQALIDSAEAAVRAARKSVGDTTLKAPGDGTVTVINGAKGEYVSPSTGTTAQAPGTAAAIPGAAAAGGAAAAAGASSRPGGTQFLVLSDVGKLQLVLPFEQSDAAQLKPDQKVTVQADAAPDSTLPGHVVSVAPSGTATSGTISYYATVSLDRTDSRLKDGQTARGTVLTLEKHNVLSVPNAAVHTQGSTSTVVLLADDGTSVTAPFEAGAVGADRTEVLSGLTEGQRVVLPSGSS
jgi:HlyD family secretion protein